MSDAIHDRTWEHLRVSTSGAIIEVALSRPDARNALNGVLMGELTEIARLLRRRTDVQVVILSGGDHNFSAGADLSSIQERVTSPTVLETREAIMLGPDMCRAWEEIEAVTIVAVEGYCIGGACALAVACDFRIMGEGSYNQVRTHQGRWCYGKTPMQTFLDSAHIAREKQNIGQANMQAA